MLTPAVAVLLELAGPNAHPSGGGAMELVGPHARPSGGRVLLAVRECTTDHLTELDARPINGAIPLPVRRLMQG